MRIRYTVPIKRKIILDDNWEIPVQGGKLRVIEENCYAKSLEIVFENQPLDYAPQFRPPDNNGNMAMITGHDSLMLSIKKQLRNAATFLECIHDIELNIDEMDAEYEGETPEEDTRITIKGISTGFKESVLPLSFSMITRAIMAAEGHDAPALEATLTRSARKSLSAQEFINSFRYSFLLIEAIYGEGQFKTAGLKPVLKSNQEFRDIVDFAIKDKIPAKDDHTSDTAILLATQPTVDAVIDHLVEKRGFYFHGNVKRKDAWKPDEQGSAESLALLAIAISSGISIRAADPIFDPQLKKRHFEDAMRAGAKIVFEVRYKFKEPEEHFTREQQVNVTVPGTKLTPQNSFSVAKYFLDQFEYNQPTSHLLKAECTVQGTRQKVFDLTFYSLENGANDSPLSASD